MDRPHSIKALVATMTMPLHPHTTTTEQGGSGEEDKDTLEPEDFEDVDLETGSCSTYAAATLGEDDGHNPDDRAVCLICYEELAMHEKLPRLPPAGASPPRQSSSASSFCPHSYCRDCIKAYLETRVHEGRAEHPCPLLGDAKCDYKYGYV